MLDTPQVQPIAFNLPKARDHYFGGAWHKPVKGNYANGINPATSEALGQALGHLDVRYLIDRRAH
jgi:hypothetical protein